MKFSRCDQMCYPCLYSRILAPGEVVWFHVYIVRLLAWALAVVPASVVYASARLSLFPVFVFSSLDPEHAIHVNFYRKNFLCVLFFVTPESSSDAIVCQVWLSSCIRLSIYACPIFSVLQAPYSSFCSALLAQTAFLRQTLSPKKTFQLPRQTSASFVDTLRA